MTPGDPRADDSSAARLRHALGVAKRLRGDYEDALRIQQQSLESMDESTRFDPTRMNVLTEIGLNLQELARPADASSSFEQALTLSRRSQTRMNPGRADILVGLGRTKMSAGRLTEALALFEEADRFWRDFDDDNRWAGEVAFWLGRCETTLHRSAAARSSFATAARILSRSPIHTDARLARVARHG